MKTTIGILGGMGPRAIVVFEQLLLQRLGGTDQELPCIVTINDGGIPDRSSYLLGRGADPVPRISRNLNLLMQAGCSVICVPCNTACAPRIYNRLQSLTGIPILNLPNEVGRSLVENNLRDVYILATEGTIKTAVFQSICKNNRIRFFVPMPRIQTLVDRIIHAIKENDLITAGLLSSEVRADIVASGTQTVILDCTELPLVKSKLVPTGLVAVDTLDILADVCVSYTKQSVMELTS